MSFLSDKKETIRRWAIPVLCAGILLCVGVTVWALFFRGDDNVPITPDYPPQGTEVNQTPIEDDGSVKMESPDGGGAINVTFATTATVSLSEKTVSLYYANPQASNQNVAILVMVDDLVVAKSDLIQPSNQITSLPLEAYAAEKLQAGGYHATLVVRAYDPASGEKAMVDTKGELELNVV